MRNEIRGNYKEKSDFNEVNHKSEAFVERLRKPRILMRNSSSTKISVASLTESRGSLAGPSGSQSSD